MLLRSHRALAAGQQQRQRASVATQAVATPAAPAATPATKHIINVIPKNGQWSNGVPPVMGAHLMASGTVAPMSTSKGAGIDVYPPDVHYFSKSGDIEVVLHATAAAAASTLAKAVFEASESAIKEKDSFTLVLSGGSLINALSSLVSLKGSKFQWEKFHIFFVDERVVPHTHQDSNYKGALDNLLSKVDIPPSQVHAILEGVPAAQAAKHYEGKLIGLPTSLLPRNAALLPVFDMILLGVGPDGHVASLFPHRSAVADTEGNWVLPVDNSPKPPAERITFTLPVINAAKDVVFYSPGEEKAEVVQRALEIQALPGSLPAQLVRPTEGRLRWLLDVQSAQFLHLDDWEDAKSFPRSQ